MEEMVIYNQLHWSTFGLTPNFLLNYIAKRLQ